MQQLNKEQAEAYVNELYHKAGARWQEKVTESPFMQQLVTGKLPMETLRLFFRNWGAWTIEINTLIACSYHKFLPFFKTNRDLMGPHG